MPADIPGVSNLDDSTSHITDLLRKIYVELKLSNIIKARALGSATLAFSDDLDQLRADIFADFTRLDDKG